MTKVIHRMYLRDWQEDTPDFCCCQCGGELFSGEVYYDIMDSPVCRDCLGVFARRYFRHCRRQVRPLEVRP